MQLGPKLPVSALEELTGKCEKRRGEPGPLQSSDMDRMTEVGTCGTRVISPRLEGGLADLSLH